MIDNIFIDNSKLSNYTISPFFNGLSDHDAQLLIIKDIKLQSQGHYVYIARNINSYSINKFKINLSYETWDCVFSLNNPDVDTLFLLCWCLHLVVVEEFEYPSNLESYAVGSLATGRATLGGEVKG